MTKLIDLLKPETEAKLLEMYNNMQAKVELAEQKRWAAWLAADMKKYEDGGYFTSADEMIAYVLGGGTVYGEENVGWGHLEPDQMTRCDDNFVAHFGQKSYDDVSFWFGWSFTCVEEWVAWVRRLADPKNLKYGKWLPTWHRDESRTPYKDWLKKT